MGKDMKVLAIGSYPAPYRVAVFQTLAKQYDMEVYFDTEINEDRNAEWFCKSGELAFYVLNNERAKKKFHDALKRVRDFDFVLAYDPARRPSIVAITCCRLCGVPYFINNDGAFIKKGNPLKATLKRFLYGGAELCLGSGDSSKAYFLANGVREDRIRCHDFTSLTEDDIYKSPASKAEQAALREKLGMKADKVYVITVGQFIERKGFDLLLKAWKDLKCSDAELMLIGGGGERTAYERYIEEHSIHNVTICGFLSKKDLFEYYRASDIFVLPTREDIWGLVINEAMACGLPIISSDMCIAARELMVSGENGYIYPVEDTDQLLHALERLITDVDLRKRFAENNITRIQGNTMENVGKKHIHDIEEWNKTRKKGRNKC